VAVHNLREYLGEATPRAVAEFARAFILSMPAGKQNTFANRTVPDAVLVAIREDQPVNLVGAFETPVAGGSGGHVKASIEALAAHARKTYGDWVSAPAVALAVGEGFADLAKAMPLADMLDRLKKEVEAR
jgi:CRISPR system Cascade subunit CasC